MTEFTLDTSGFVLSGFTHATDPDVVYGFRWPDLSPFEQGYVEALLQSFPVYDRTTASPREQETRCGFSDLAPETLAAIRKDCAARAQELRQLFSPLRYGRTQTDGANFWTRRQSGHEPDYAKRFPPLTVTLGDDGKVVFS